jgi:hypothetical protein
MPEDIQQLARTIASRIDKSEAQAAVNSRALLIIEIATITLMVDAKVITIEESVQRIQKIRKWLLVAFPSDDVSRRVDDAIDLLRDHANDTIPQPRSTVIDRLLNKPS